MSPPTAPPSKPKRHFNGISAKTSTAEVKAKLKALFSPHVESFDHFLEEGLESLVANLEQVELDARGRCGADGAESGRQRCRGRAARPRVRWFASRIACRQRVPITDAAVKEFWLSEGFELVVFLFSLI